MPKKTRKSKPKKTRKLARKLPKKTARKPAKKTTAKKKPARKTAKPARRTAAAKSVMTVKAAPPMKPKAAPTVPRIAEQRAGVVTHYYSHLSVAVVKLDQGALRVGDTIHIKGHTTDFQQRVESMQVEHQSIESAQVGEEFGLKVTEHVREHDVVYKVIG
jgi:putative protease